MRKQGGVQWKYLASCQLKVVKLLPLLLPRLKDMPEDIDAGAMQSAVEVLGKLPAEELVKLVPRLPRLEHDIYGG